MRGTVLSVEFDRANVVTDTGKVVVVWFANVPRDEADRAYLLPHEEIELGIGNIEILSPREPIDLATYREVGRIQMVGGKRSQFAFLDREFFSGARVFLHANDLVAGSPKLEVGDLYEYALEPPLLHKTVWQAKAAAFVQAA